MKTFLYWLFKSFLKLVFDQNQQNYERVERPISSTRHASSSRKAVVSSVRATSSADFTENRSSRVVPNNGRSSTAQRTQLIPDPTTRPSSSSFARAAPSRTARDITLQSFELLTIGNGKRKWEAGFIGEWVGGNYDIFMDGYFVFISRNYRFPNLRNKSNIIWLQIICDKYMVLTC